MARIKEGKGEIVPHRLWDTVRNIIEENYEKIKSIPTKDSYYIITDLLKPRIGEDINSSEYDYFCSGKGYSYYCSQFWRNLEETRGLIRPRFIEENVIYMEDEEYDKEQIRGIILVEKREIAESIRALCDYGWMIIVGKSIPTEYFGFVMKNDERRILLLHNYGKNGDEQLQNLFRDAEMDLSKKEAIADRVIDLGLTLDDITKLELPPKPSKSKTKDIDQYELSALSILQTRMNIEDYLFVYATTKMQINNIVLSPLEISNVDILKKELNESLHNALNPLIDKAVTDALNRMKDPQIHKNKSVTVRFPPPKSYSDGKLKKTLAFWGIQITQRASFVNEKEYQIDSLSKVDSQLYEILTKEKKEEE